MNMNIWKEWETERGGGTARFLDSLGCSASCGREASLIGVRSALFLLKGGTLIVLNAFS